MLKVECTYRAKMDIMNSLLDYIDNSKEELTISDIRSKVLRSIWFYRKELAELER